MGRAQVFDVNETLLDLAAMDPHFERIFGDSGARLTWFSQMIQSALVATVTGAYHPLRRPRPGRPGGGRRPAAPAPRPPRGRRGPAWDVAGAARAGCVTAFVARSGKVLDPLVERPEIVGVDLAEVTDAILAVEQQDGRRP
jgi:hypothetical protein